MIHRSIVLADDYVVGIFVLREENVLFNIIRIYYRLLLLCHYHEKKILAKPMDFKSGFLANAANP